MLFHKEDDSHSIGGVGILMHKGIVSHLLIVKTKSNRVLFITSKIHANVSIKVVQKYAPTRGLSFFMMK